MRSTRRLGKPSVTLDDIKHFRQIGSKAPGHPEYHLVSGVETTTGPLGQGIATSVGMAIAAEMARHPLQPAGLRDLRLQHLCRLRRRLHDGRCRRPRRRRSPGHLALDNLCWIYDNNHITIEGNTRITFTEDIAARFLGYGWNVLRVGDANDSSASSTRSTSSARPRAGRR